MTSIAELAQTSYSYERLCFDRWAAWCDGQWSMELGVPRETLLSKVAHFGIRVGISRAGTEPEIHDEPEIVSELMEAWAASDLFSHRQSHMALMARHRRIIRGVRISQLTDAQGKPKRFRDSDFALLIIGGQGRSATKTFQRICHRGYVELRERFRAHAGTRLR